MLDTIPNLWPAQFKIDVQTPFTILQVQAGLLSKVTRGILQGAVETEIGTDVVQHRLVVVAPAYNGYRHTLVVALHNRNLPYPAEVRADALAQKVEKETSLKLIGRTEYHTVFPNANDDEQMLALVGRVLHSEPTKAIVLSLIAKSNEASQPSAPIAQVISGDSEIDGGHATALGTDVAYPGG